jgi:hypothetical protein
VKIRFVGPDHVDFGHVRMHRHVVLDERRVQSTDSAARMVSATWLGRCAQWR